MALTTLLTIAAVALLSIHVNAISYCGGQCRTLNDCYGQLICISGKCNDDPDVGTHICRSSPPPPPAKSPPPPPAKTPPPPPVKSPPPPPPSATCNPYGTLTCSSGTYTTYNCSPPVYTSTSAILTNNDFSEGGDGGAASECTESYYDNSQLVVALSTGWYNGGSRCLSKIKITAPNGKTAVATVVDECDSMVGCDADHANQPPCRNNIVDGSDGVWSALGLDTAVGEVSVTWSAA